MPDENFIFFGPGFAPMDIKSSVKSRGNPDLLIYFLHWMLWVLYLFCLDFPMRCFDTVHILMLGFMNDMLVNSAFLKG